MARNLRKVKQALENAAEPPADAWAEDTAAPGIRGNENTAPDNKGDGDGPRVPLVMPKDCPVVPVGTEGGVFYFLTALGELRDLTCDKVANKHIVGMFAPSSQYLIDTWPRKKKVQVKDPETGEMTEDWIVTGWRNDDVAMLLMDVAAKKGVWNARERVRGRGAWVDEDGTLILHCGGHILYGGAWRRPGMYGDMVYPTAPPMPRPASKAGQTALEIAPNLVEVLRARGTRIADDATPAYVLWQLLKTWNWGRPTIDPILLLGWQGAAMLGGALNYRPLAWITGDAATGKSSLQKLIGWLHQGGILQSPDASEAGVRQVLGQQSLPVGIDEAEPDAEGDSRKMLALVKLARLAATSQGNILRGGNDHRGHEFQATSCFLFSSILVPPISPADRSRLAVLELGTLPAGAREPKMIEREIAAIGAALRRRMVDRWRQWPKILEAYKDALIDYGGHGGRISDQFGTLLAAAHVMLNDEAPDDEDLMQWGELLRLDRLAEASDNADEASRCVQHLGTSLVQLAGHGTPRMVSDWLLQATEPTRGAGIADDDEIRERRRSAGNMLAKIGMRIVVGRAREGADDGRPRPVPGREYVAIAHAHQGLARLFADSRWAAGVWAQAIKRVNGAIAGDKQRIGGLNVRCTLVPVDMIVSREDEAEEVAAVKVGEVV